MTDQAIIIEVAKLDGWIETPYSNFPRQMMRREEMEKECPKVGTVPDYPTSRDAIIPVIEKAYIKDGQDFFCAFWDALNEDTDFFEEHGHTGMLLSTPRQLCIALLKATGKWRSENE